MRTNQPLPTKKSSDIGTVYNDISRYRENYLSPEVMVICRVCDHVEIRRGFHPSRWCPSCYSGNLRYEVRR